MHSTSHTRLVRTRRTVVSESGREHTVYRPLPSRGVQLRRALVEQHGGRR